MRWQRKHKRDGQKRRREFWGKRPLAYTESNAKTKRTCRKIERAQFKQQTYKEMQDE